MNILRKTKNRKAVSPIIATLLLVAIAVVGGALIFSFAQGYFTSSQTSGRPNIEQYKISGYDASDTGLLKLHDGNTMTTTAFTNSGTAGLKANDVISVYVENKSAQKITITDLLFGGTKYTYLKGTGTTAIAALVNPATSGQFALVTDATTEFSSAATGAEFQPGQSGTLVLKLTEDIKDGRDVQLKLTTGNGNVLVGTLIAGQQEG